MACIFHEAWKVVGVVTTPGTSFAGISAVGDKFLAD